MVATDILGPFPESETGNSYILVATDYFTWWVEAYPIHDQETTTVAKKLTNEMFLWFSPPEQLHSYQGRQFEFRLLAEMCKLLHIQKLRTSYSISSTVRWISWMLESTHLGMLVACLGEHPEYWQSMYGIQTQVATDSFPSMSYLGDRQRSQSIWCMVQQNQRTVS